MTDTTTLHLRELLTSAVLVAIEASYPYEGFVYFLRPVGAVEPIKIGFTTSLSQRLEHYLTHSPLFLNLVALAIGSVGDERALHSLFRRDHSHGEWFSRSPELDAVIAAYAVTEDAVVPVMARGPESMIVSRRRELSQRHGAKGMPWMEM